MVIAFMAFYGAALPQFVALISLLVAVLLRNKFKMYLEKHLTQRAGNLKYILLTI